MQNHPPIDVKEKERTDPLAPRRSGRRPYQRPQLTRYGDVRDLTLGSSGDFPESGGNYFPR